MVRALTNPYEYIHFLKAVHDRAPVDENLEIQFRDLTVAGQQFLSLYRDCLGQTGATVESWKIFRRALRALNLVKYYEYAAGLNGDRAECGVLSGFSSLLVSKVHRLLAPGYAGAGYHLIDSFEGLSEPTQQDAIGIRTTPEGRQEPVYSHDKGKLANSLEATRSVMGDFPEVSFHKGWIPDVFADLPETTWSFVHVDVDLYEPTYRSLEYFVPRLVKGGCIINDDFASLLFPGGGQGWIDYFGQKELPFVVLDSGQSVFIKE